MALLPLLRNGELIGSLNFGSRNSDWFAVNLGTVFLEHLGAIVAACLKNAINQERLKQIGLVDALTGINNRRFFDQRLVEEVTGARRRGGPLSCLFLDIDHFKRVNDTFNHRVGDQVLCEVARVIKNQLRVSDVLARYGGEEFVALLPDSDAAGAVVIAERIRQQIEGLELKTPDGALVHISISIGIDSLGPEASQRMPAASADALITRADRALLYAKEHGRNQVVCVNDIILKETA